MIKLFILLFAYFVSFVDKPEKTAPQLSPRAVEQRQKWGIETDQADYPVSTHYTDSLRRMGIKIYHRSRWFNGVTCEMDETTAEQVARISFVKAVEMTRDNSEPIFGINRRKHAEILAESTQLHAESVPTDEQLALYNLLPLHEAGYEGQGILMAICDGGFYRANSLECFRQNELELGHFDFTDDTDDFYGETGSHGTGCLSTISGITEGYYGAATKAQYYLMRSEEMENNRECPKEMDNLVAALEKADSLGVNVFSVSLGYYQFDNSDWNLQWTDLDGRTTRVSRAATLAARKGMLVCVAAGNEGNKPWKYICAPADADSVLTVGAVDTEGIAGSFSSYGPAADGRVKPDVCAVGVSTLILTPYGFAVNSNGTSYATPLLAGLAASLWSALPDENAMQIRERIIRSADRYSEPETTQYGYGIPDAWKAYTMKPTAIDEAASDKVQSTKVLRNGKIWILRGRKTYSIDGRLVR